MPVYDGTSGSTGLRRAGGSAVTMRTSNSGNLSMSGTITPKLKSSDSETRPVNMTIKVWKRIA